MGLSPAEVALSVFDYVSNSIGICANLLLIFLVVKKSPKHIAVYSILLLNFGITDLVGCVAGLFVQQRLIPLGGSIGFFSLGPCRYLSSTACYIGYSFTLHCYSHSLWSILISFVFRYRILVTKMPSFSSLLTVVLLAYSVSLFQLVVCILAESPTEDIIALLQQTRPDYDLSGKTISGNLNIFGWKELFTNLHMSLPIVPVYIVIIILSVVIIRHLRTTAMSEQTKAMHSQLFKALLVQAFLPAFYLGTIMVFVLEQAGVLNSAFLEYAMMQFVGLLPVISPIFTLYFVIPYRRWIFAKLSCKGREVVPHSGFSNTDQTIVKI